MSEETSVHWHGLLLPNFYDGVPYLNTPPIEPGHTQKYEFPIRQSGTYWYHTRCKNKAACLVQLLSAKTNLTYDKDLVLMLSD
jgi:FtsP/CotA-like multicopper oxidase with cupredoxin domain